jgi:hypothetical protein
MCLYSTFICLTKILVPFYSVNIIKLNVLINSFFLIRLLGGGVQLGPLDTAATDWPKLNVKCDKHFVLFSPCS